TSKDNDNVTIRWDDHHKSHFSLEWLKQRSFSKENQEKFLNETYKISRVLWDGKELSHTKKYDYEEIMTK
ncbi:hypothetical protein ILUMI_09468, partial [Ignelater luminosus]